MKNNTKKLLAGLSSACVLASAIPVASLSAQAIDYDNVNVHYGDANLDDSVTLNDAVAILQFCALSTKYPLSNEAQNNADVYNRGDGISPSDALAIQWVDAGIVLTEGDFAGQTASEETLPISWKDGKPSSEDPVADIVYIHLNGSSISVEGDNSGYTAVSGSTVTISHSGTFYVDGTLDDGQINVNVADEVADPETVKIFLNGANICGKSSPAVLITNAENTSINLVDGTTNTISDGDTAYAGDFLGAAVIEAKDDLTIKGGELGTGVLDLTANTQDGIVCNNDLKINGGVVNVTTLNANDGTNGINGKASLTVKAGTLTVDAEGDGIKSGNGNVAVSGGTLNIKAGNDAIQSGTTIDISGGTVMAGGDRGFTSTTGVNITGGTVIATATDNQTDAALLSSANQATMLLNCIDDASNTDGCWKKANALMTANVTASKWEKKYKYVLISDPSITTGQTYTLTNASTGTAATHSNGAENTFAVTNSVTTFDTVDPSGAGGAVVTDPIVTTDGYTITFASDGASTNAPADVATVANGVVTITKESAFAVTGSSNSGQIVVDVDKTAYPSSVVELDLTGVELSNSTTAPIYVASIGDEVQIVAKKDTVNTISDGTSHTQTYTDSDGNTNTVEGAIFSRDDIKFKGSGTLTVNGNTDDAIVCKNDIKIYNGTLFVNAVDDGIRGKDSVTIGDTTKSDGSAADNSGINVTVKTQSGDGIKSTATDTATDKSYGLVTINGGTVNITSYSDGIQAEQDLVINGGDLTIKTYQGSSYTGTGSSSSSGSTNPWGGGMGMDGNANKTDISAKGIKAVGLYDAAGTTWQSKGNITINGGNINIDSSDDCVHCGGDMKLYGGIFNVASADDGFHSDHNLDIGQTVGNTFDNVQIFISKCYEGVEAPTINQNSGTVYVISTDDGYNAGGGADASGTGNTGGPGSGWGQGTTTSSGNIVMNLKGGLAVVNSANGDHDGFDSNGNIVITGGYYCANGQEPLDCGDNGATISLNGGSVISMTAGNTNLNTRYTFVDNSGKAVVSFLSGSVGGLRSGSTGSAQSGGSVSGGTTIMTQAGNNTVTVGGTLSGGTTLGQASESQGPGGRF